MENQAVLEEKPNTYIDFKDVKINNHITLSIKESGRTVDSIKKREKVFSIISSVLVYAFILVLALTVIFPFYWMIITSLKQNQEITASTQTFFPNIVMWSNYSYVFQVFDFMLSFKMDKGKHNVVLVYKVKGFFSFNKFVFAFILACPLLLYIIASLFPS